MERYSYILAGGVDIAIRTPSRGRNAKFAATAGSVSVYRVPQMRGAGRADVLVILQVPGNKADGVPCERLPRFKAISLLL